MKASRTALLIVACGVLSSHPVWAGDVVRSIAWQELAAAQKLQSGTVVADPSGALGPSLRVVHAGSTPATLPLVTIERPGITSARYALRGRVRYVDVAAGSYLEMWSRLPDGAFFSRTLAAGGPMGRLDGSSEWRTFVLPFVNREGGAPPDSLDFNLVLTGAGTVEIGPVEVVQFAAGEDPMADPSAWWSDRQAGLFGGVVGSALGLLGALIGWLGSGGRARGFVLGALGMMAWMGVGALVLGVSALALDQPYVVFYPLLLIGGISAALGFALPRGVSKRYEELELRRMQSLDA